MRKERRVLSQNDTPEPIMRIAETERNTLETKIKISLNLDGSGNRSIDTGIGFFNHMLELFAVHGAFDMSVVCDGDINVDGHHSVEDVGITLGKCIASALGDKKGIERFGNMSVPMDQVLCNVSLDISGRPYLVFNAKCEGKCGDFDMELVEEFLRAVAMNAGLTLHVNVLYGSNNHHIAEAIFKSFARALRQAVKITGDTIPSSKGVIE